MGKLRSIKLSDVEGYESRALYAWLREQGLYHDFIEYFATSEEFTLIDGVILIHRPIVDKFLRKHHV